MTKSQFLNELEEILELSTGELKGDENLSELEGWDSLATLLFIGMIDEKLNLHVAAKSIANANTVGDLVALLGDAITE